jgi:hypothetical protein
MNVEKIVLQSAGSFSVAALALVIRKPVIFNELG